MFKNTYKNLNIRSKDIKNNVLNNLYGGYGKEPQTSFELEWDKVENAKSYGLIFIDYDAVHVVGKPFIHWLVLNIRENKLKKNATFLDKDILVQGQNSRTTIGWLDVKDKKLTKEEILQNANYTGPFPPDKSHIYKIIIFALDFENTNLPNGYFMDEMLKEVENHVIAYDELNFEYIKPN